MPLVGYGDAHARALTRCGATRPIAWRADMDCARPLRHPRPRRCPRRSGAARALRRRARCRRPGRDSVLGPRCRSPTACSTRVPVPRVRSSLSAALAAPLSARDRLLVADTRHRHGSRPRRRVVRALRAHRAGARSRRWPTDGVGSTTGGDREGSRSRYLATGELKSSFARVCPSASSAAAGGKVFVGTPQGLVAAFRYDGRRSRAARCRRVAHSRARRAQLRNGGWSIYRASLTGGEFELFSSSGLARSAT
jgi:hypothetical protein